MRSFVLVILAVCVAGAPSWGRSFEEVRLLSSTEESAQVEVIFPEATVLPDVMHPGYQALRVGGMPPIGDPGQPSFPRASFWIAVPPGATVEVQANPREERIWDGIRPLPIATPSWISEKGDELPSYRESVREAPGTYAGGTYPVTVAEAGPVATLRYVRAVPITVSPARWDASTGALRVARRVEISIRFVRGSMREARVSVGRDDATWERTLDSTVLNAKQARTWMSAPAQPARSLRRAWPSGPTMKLEVRSTGPCRVEYADLVAAGWDPQGDPLASLRLYERFYDSNDAAPEDTVDVPILIVDADESGTWTEGDSFYFYGQMLYDRLPDAPWYLKRYGRMHAYWLGIRSDAPNARMESAPSWLGAGDLTPVESYPWTTHFEKESEAYMKPGAVADLDNPDNMVRGVAAVRSKHVYWKGGDAYSGSGESGLYRVEFDLPGFLEAQDFTTRFQGIMTAGGIYRVTLYFSRGGLAEATQLPRTPFEFGNQDAGTYTAGPADLVGMPLAATGNRLLFTEAPQSEGAALVSFDVTYLRQPGFTGGAAQITTVDRTGPTEYLLPLPPQDDLVGIDWTDPRAPKALTIDPATQIEGNGPSRRLRLQFDLAGQPRRIDVRAAGAVPKPSAIVPGSTTDLLAPFAADYVMVIPRAWIPTAQPLIDQRTAQGHTVLVAAIEDVYDQFSGGRHWPHAIRSMLRAFFRANTLGPSYLCLVGDGSEVFDNPLASETEGYAISAPNWVPTQTMFSQSYSGQGPELVTTDQWFVDNLIGTGENLTFLPDMHVGRLPAGSPLELERVVAKILAYESFSPDDTWRNRALFVGDDIWSNRIDFGGEAYRPHPGLGDEAIFAETGREAMALIADQGPQCGFAADSFSVAAYMDTAAVVQRCARRDPTSGRCVEYNPNADWVTNFTYGGSVVRDLLLQAMGRGHLIVTYTGHANGRLMSHEYIFRHAALSGREDISLLSNLGRPFLYMGFGCHLNEFAAFNEGLFGKGDGIGENLLTWGYDPPTTGAEDDRAGIGSIASSGYEWIPTSDVLCLSLMRSFFESPPVYPPPPAPDGHTRWILGEVLTASKRDLVASGFGSLAYKSMSATYGMFGDPGLVMDAAPPSIAATIDDQPAQPGQPLILPADRDSIEIAAQVCDEVWARSLSIQDVGRTVEPDTIVQGDDDRHFRALYRTTVMPRTYDLILSAEDANGRTSTLTFPVRCDVVFQVKKPGGGWTTLDEGARVLGDDSVRVNVDAPRYLTAADFEVRAGGGVAQVLAKPTDAIDGRARSWGITLLDPVPVGGQVILSLKIRQPDGAVFQIDRRIETELAHEILALYNVPNPFEDRTSIFYLLGEPATRVTIKIYTTSGKLVRTLDDLPSRQLESDPPVDWDGTDADGDPVGNGLYFYKLFVQSPKGTLTKIEKLARVR
jgi:hypothetical protein